MEDGGGLLRVVLLTPLTKGASKDSPILGSDLKAAPVATSLEGLSTEQVAAAFYGKSIENIAEAFTRDGFNVKTTLSERSSSTTPPTQFEIKGTDTKKLGKFSITQIEFHPGGGIHGGAYYRISGNTPPKYKVVDPATYKPPPQKEKCEYIWVEGLDAAMPKGTK